jgi:hypothetical protein
MRTIERLDQRMSKFVFFTFVSVGLLATSVLNAKTVHQGFSSDPLQNGWQEFGNTNLFHWNSTNQNLEVTWDSRESNSFFYIPLGTSLTRSDDFTLEFDLLLNDIVSGIEPGKTGPLEIGFGFYNFAIATNNGFSRAFAAADVVEFDYFPYGYYDFGGMIFDSPATATPTFISSSGTNYAPTIFAPYSVELPTNTVVHVQINFTSSNQTLTTLLTTNGSLFFQPPDVVLTNVNTSGFGALDDYLVDTFSINNYSSAGDDFDSVFGHGIVDNIVITYPLPLENFTGSFSNGVWQATFSSRTNWTYTLERTTDFQSWTSVSPTISGDGLVSALQDATTPPQNAFYRVRATRQ